MGPPNHKLDRSNDPRTAGSEGGRLDSRDLFRDQRRIDIVHGDQTYHLQITRLGKLILTK